MRIIVNGKPLEVKEKPDLRELVLFCKISPESAIIELNGTVIRKALWAGTILNEDDRVEFISLVGGG
jgi:sulfur carrier protein